MRRLQPPSGEPLRSALASAVRRSTDARHMHRLDAVLLVSAGCSCYEVAHWLGADPRSVERWVHLYARRGSEGLRDQPPSGRPAHLTPPQCEQLARQLAGPPGLAGYRQARWSGKLLARHLELHYRVQLSQRHCQRLLQGLARPSH